MIPTLDSHHRLQRVKLVWLAIVSEDSTKSVGAATQLASTQALLSELERLRQQCVNKNINAIPPQLLEDTCRYFKQKENLPVSHDYTLYGLHLCAAFF